MNIESFRTQLNSWSQEKIPFLFVTDFELQQPFACKLENAADENIFYDFRGLTNFDSLPAGGIEIQRMPPSFTSYEKKINAVFAHLRQGDSFLTNLTMRTEITINRSLPELLRRTRAKYRLLFKDQFLVFSPETFVRIEGTRISAYPMKGTIDASVPDAERILLTDKKEMAEHVTIVDLLRNDLSQVSDDVSVDRFRYLERVRTGEKDLWQMSSEISGVLPSDFTKSIGDVLLKLLPAGSVSGAPKTKTLEIIRRVEGEPRGFYTGVFGYFDGKQLDSAVMIRYIEKSGDRYFYRSGGGITTQSDPHSEYQEAIDKIYVPLD